MLANSKKMLALLAGTVIVAAAVMSCQPIQITTDFNLGAGLKTFDVQAGVPVEKSGTGSIGDTPVDVGSGTIQLQTSAITFTPSNAGEPKGTVNLQDNMVLEVTVWVSDVEAVETVCQTGDQYGPFEVTLDENYVPVSVDPSQVTLTQNTIRLLNEGEFSFCIRALSPIDGTVVIDSLRFTVGL